MNVVEIARIAAGGDGVGRLADGKTVFVPRTAPGDVVEVELVELKARYARARVTRVLTPSPVRVEPACAHYVVDRCGGCQLQHLSPDAQLESKRRLVGDAMRRIGAREVTDPPATPSGDAWRYRTRITLAVSGPVIGLHRLGDPVAIFDLTDCLITSEPLMALWRRIAEHRHHLPPDITSLVLRQDRQGGLHAIASGGTTHWNPLPLATAVGVERVSYWWKPLEGAARVVAGERTGFAATAFEQVNPGLADAIRGRAVKALGDVSGRTVWDLYGGVGDTARELCARGARVWSVDADRSAIDWAVAAGGAITYIAASVENVLGRLAEPDAVIVNPPRTGLDARVSKALNDWAGARPGSGRRLAYVSCDPATLARDLRRMPALELVDLGAYDLFPQTAHVEALAVLEAR